MSRSTYAAMGVLMLISLSACADDKPITAPEWTQPSESASHTWSQGNGSAWHGYLPPIISRGPDESALELCATWNDPSLFKRDGGAYADTHFFSFDFDRRTDESAGWERIGSANSRDPGEPGCYIIGELPVGSHEFRVTGMARHGKGKGTTTHHSVHGEQRFVVGEPGQFAVVVTVEPSLVEIQGGGEVQLTVKVARGDEMVEDATVLWTSDNVEVAVVSSGGLVTAATDAHGHAKITATFSEGGSSWSGNATVTVPRWPPSVEIRSPADGAEFGAGESVSFSGFATDADGAALSGGQLVWTSDREGQLAAGEVTSSTTLSVGRHEISLRATDSFGLSSTAKISIRIVEAAEAMPPLVAQTISAGENHSCGLTADGRAYCWGYNAYAQLGDGSTTTSLIPVAVNTDLRFVQISAGAQRTCALTSSGDAYCWGENYYGPVGNGTNRSTGLRVWLPALVTGGHQWQSLTTGRAHSCGVRTDGAALCWGWNGHGQLGNGGTGESSIPVLVEGGYDWRIVTAARNNHSCGLTTDGVAYCWGDNNSMQFGDGTDDTKSSVPKAVLTQTRFRELVTGTIHTCGIDLEGAAWCWGSGVAGKLGDGTATSRSVPVQVTGGLRFSSLAAGSAHTCGVTPAGTGYCWGWNSDGRLGTGSTLASSYVPTQLSGDLSWSTINAGHEHSCGITRGGVALCWGENLHGRLGDGTTIDRNVPTRVSGWEEP